MAAMCCAAAPMQAQHWSGARTSDSLAELKVRPAADWLKICSSALHFGSATISSEQTSISVSRKRRKNIMKLRFGLVAASLLGALAASPAASAMPIAPAPATSQVSDVEQVRMVCDAWGRCFWRPNYYGYYGA